MKVETFFLTRNSLEVIIIGGSRGHRDTTSTPPPPPGAQIFSIFMQYLGNFGKIVCWHLPGEILDLPLILIDKIHDNVF